MGVPITDIQKRVRVILNENTDSAEFDDLGKIDVLGIDEIITEAIVPAAVQVATAAPLGMCETAALNTENNVTYLDDYCEIVCPSDLLKLGSVKMADWAHPIYTVTSTTTDLYKRQFSPVKSSHATPTRPLMALIEGADNRNLLQLFPADSEQGIEYASYVPRPAFNSASTELLHLSAPLLEATCYQCAALTCLALDEIDKYNALTQTSKNLINA